METMLNQVILCLLSQVTTMIVCELDIHGDHVESGNCVCAMLCNYCNCVLA